MMSCHRAAGVFGSNMVLAVPGLLAALRLDSGTLTRLIPRVCQLVAPACGLLAGRVSRECGDSSGGRFRSRHRPVSSPCQTRGRRRGPPFPGVGLGSWLNSG